MQFIYKNQGDDGVAEWVEQDFERRRQERKAIERGWQLNMNFVNGNQYCGIDRTGEIAQEENGFYWQVKRVFNHIAPIVDTRLAKLSRIRPALAVRAASDGESDRHSAELASAILAAKKGDLDEVITAATVWSEICGTAFYKVVWDFEGGATVGKTAEGKRVRCGDIKLRAISPFEIYPYSLYEENLQAQQSIIHAKVLPVEEIYSMYGVKLEGRDSSEFDVPSNCNWTGNMCQLTEKRPYELVLERYEKSTAEKPEGRLTVVAGGKVLFDGDMPYANGDNGAKEYPFVKQVSLPVAGSFFGASVVERLIPVQRAYNALKNRKHEFLNRIAAGTFAVEDGSVDLDELTEEGLMPGKVVVYRQGANPPAVMSAGSVPDEFWKEENSLLAEFNKIAGSGDLSENADMYSGITSATGLQIIIEQDEERLNVSYTSIKRALALTGRQILRLYRQFASDVRLIKYTSNNDKLQLFYFKGSDITSDDVVLESDSELNLSPAQKRAAVMELLDRGLFLNDEGKLTQSAKSRVLELMGYPALSGERDLAELNRARAGEENLVMKSSSAEVNKLDDHRTHITEHTAFMLSEKLTKEAERRIAAHIENHKKFLKGDYSND